ncbi:hypothetical protein BDR03DRAFT_985916 [Suillus americanus]|nr:hypothetical protein BDR03DRAFT_985916 [Suillus americanus]
MDCAGQMCKDAIRHFEFNCAILPSWGEEVDRQVVIYVEGMQHWMIGSLHWHFDSAHYFGKDGHAVKQDQIVKLLPKLIIQLLACNTFRPSFVSPLTKTATIKYDESLSWNKVETTSWEDWRKFSVQDWPQQPTTSLNFCSRLYCDSFGRLLLSSAVDRNFYFEEGGRVSGEVTSFVAGVVEDVGRIEVPGG